MADKRSMMMMMMVVVVVLVMVVGVEGSYDETDWGFQSYLDENYTLDCDHESLQVDPQNHVEWELPGGHPLTQTMGRFVLTPGLRGSVTNMHLTIVDVQDEDAGVYLCHVYNNIRKEVKRGQLLRGLNIGGPKYRDQFDEYRHDLMVGGLAAVVLFVPLVSFCLIYKFRFQTKEDRETKHADRLELTRHQRHLDTHGKGTSSDLSQVSVNGGKGETNPVYDSSMDDAGTRL